MLPGNCVSVGCCIKSNKVVLSLFSRTVWHVLFILQTCCKATYSVIKTICFEKIIFIYFWGTIKARLLPSPLLGLCFLTSTHHHSFTRKITCFYVKNLRLSSRTWPFFFWFFELCYEMCRLKANVSDILKKKIYTCGGNLLCVMWKGCLHDRAQSLLSSGGTLRRNS